MQTAFFTRINGKFQRIPFRNILYITAKKNYSEVLTLSNKKICIYASLSWMEEQLPASWFCRIHRSYLIGLQNLEAFDHNYVYIGKEELPISKSYFESLTTKLLVISNGYDKRNEEESKVINVEEYLTTTGK